MWKSVIFPAVVVSILWIAVSVFTTRTFNSIFESNARSISEDVTTIESAWAMRRDAWRIQTAWLEALQSNSPNANADIRNLEDRFQNSLEAAKNTSFTAPELALVDTIRERFTAYSGQIHQSLSERNANPEHPFFWDRDKITQLAASLTDACRQLSELNGRLINERSSQNQRAFSFLSMMRQIFLVIGPGLGIVLGLLLSRRISRSVGEIGETLKHADQALAQESPSELHGPTEELPALHRQADLVAHRVGKVVIELENTRQRIIQSERLAAVGELAAGVAHEIRNPLTSVKLLIQNAQLKHPGRAMDPKQTEIILQEISRMESLIQDLLNFARPPRLHITRHDVRPTLRRTFNLVSARAKQRNIEILDELENAEIMLNGDVEQLLLVFINLAINGLEAMNGGTFRVSAISADKCCRIVFRDEGPGIPEEVLRRLFEPFTTTKERGTGLGLAISRRIVLQHGGTLVAENLSSGGAALTVELPLSFEPVPNSTTLATRLLSENTQSVSEVNVT